MSSPIIPPGKSATITAKPLLLKLPDQQPTAPLAYPVAFTGSVLFCSVDRDNAHIRHCRVDRDSVHMQRYCHRMRVQSIALPLLHRRQRQLLDGRPWDRVERPCYRVGGGDLQRGFL